MKSWKTTATGILAAIGLVIPNIQAILSDGMGAFSWEVWAAALGAAGFGFFARDNNVSSEEAGAKK